jgi:ribulose bisphosphate carboxylase small subunit
LPSLWQAIKQLKREGSWLAGTLAIANNGDVLVDLWQCRSDPKV